MVADGSAALPSASLYNRGAPSSTHSSELADSFELASKSNCSQPGSPAAVEAREPHWLV